MAWRKVRPWPRSEASYRRNLGHGPYSMHLQHTLRYVAAISIASISQAAAWGICVMISAQRVCRLTGSRFTCELRAVLSSPVLRVGIFAAVSSWTKRYLTVSLIAHNRFLYCPRMGVAAWQVTTLRLRQRRPPPPPPPPRRLPPPRPPTPSPPTPPAPPTPPPPLLPPLQLQLQPAPLVSATPSKTSPMLRALHSCARGGWTPLPDLHGWRGQPWCKATATCTTA